MLACRGRVVVMGMGKSGHVGRKIAATLASTGTPAFFVHPGRGQPRRPRHGDRAATSCSRSPTPARATSSRAILPALRRLGVDAGRDDRARRDRSARHADIVLSSAVDQEACPLNLAPTASTTAQMALGDALAVALLDARGFREEDFARSHPGGASAASC